jgi:hypothetical protein
MAADNPIATLTPVEAGLSPEARIAAARAARADRATAAGGRRLPNLCTSCRRIVARAGSTRHLGGSLPATGWQPACD